MTSQGYEERGEVFIREIEFAAPSQAAYDPIPSQWTLSQRDDTSPPFPLPRRKSRIQHEGNGCNSPRSESDNSLSPENDFAKLEALLEDQQKICAPRMTNVAAVAEKDFQPTRPIVDPDNLRSARNDDGVNNDFITNNDLMEHPSTRQPTLSAQAETTTREPSRAGAYTNRSSHVDPPQRKLASKSSTMITSSLLDNTSLSHSSILEKSRKMAAQSTKQRPSRVISTGRSHSTQSSIISGPRPPHWDQRDLAVSNKRRARSLDTSSKRSRAAVLSAFTQHKAGEGRLASSRKHVTAPATTPARQQIPDFSMIQNQDPIVDDVEHEKPKETVHNGFTVSLMSIASSPVANADSTIASPQYQSPQLQSSFGARNKKSKALFSGRLCKRLQSIRDTIRGDKMRFQSGQYPFSLVSLDMNDPRNRATSVLDITLVETSGMSNRESQKVLMLGFVHHATGSLSHLMSQFAWVCLGCDTARELTIRNGSQLRLYNAVSMELSGPLCDPSSCRLATFKWMVLATTLCELYPKELPQLPDAPAINDVITGTETAA